MKAKDLYFQGINFWKVSGDMIFDGETRTIDVHVRSLRQKLGNSGNIIETVRGIGYRIGEGS